MRIGDRVDARYDGRSKWYPGNVASMNADDTIDITYDSGMWNGWEGVTEYGVKPGLYKASGSTAVVEPPSVAPPAPPLCKEPMSAITSSRVEFSIGQRVEAKHKGKSKWFSATVMEVNGAGGDSFRVCYDGGMWNSWLAVTEPKVPRADIRCSSGEEPATALSSRARGGGSTSASSSFDTSPIRRAKEEEAAAAAAFAAGKSSSVVSAAKQRKGAKKAKSSSELLQTLESPAPAERSSTRQAQAHAAAQAEAKSKEVAGGVGADAKASGDADLSSSEVTGGCGGGGSGRRKSSLASFRETKAMRAQREAALKRREVLELSELEKYGETFEAAKQKKKKLESEAAVGAGGGGATPHSFLKRTGSSYTPRAAGNTSSGSNVSALPQAAEAPPSAPTEQYRAQKQKQQQQALASSLGENGNERSEQQTQPTPQPQQRAAAVAAQQEKRRQMLDESRPQTGMSTGLAQTGDGTNPNGASGFAQTAPPVQVIVRKRPAGGGEVDCVKISTPLVVCYENKVKVDLTKYVHTHKFVYDASFGEADNTTGLYESSVKGLIDNFVGGGSSTCFCFGQTASGKTFTLFGAGGGQVMEGGQAGSQEFASDPELGGVYMLAAMDVFHRIQQSLPHLCLAVSMFEIYGQKVRDLLNGSVELAALEDGKGVLQLVGLASQECEDMDDFVRVSNVGRSARSTTATGANATSSRSHAAMLLRLVRRGGQAADAKGKPKPSIGKFSLIDLAGSERGADNENTDKTTQMEGRQINQSLLALKEVIRAKELGRSHAPFRQSRLTQVLEESLTGKRCQTVVIGCVSPSEKDIQQTINTLRYAEGLRPGLKKDLAKREKEQAQAFARDAARDLAAEADKQAAGFGRDDDDDDEDDDEGAYEDAVGGPSPALGNKPSAFMDLVRQNNRSQQPAASGGGSKHLELLAGLDSDHDDDDDSDLGGESSVEGVVGPESVPVGRLLSHDLDAEEEEEEVGSEDHGYDAYGRGPRVLRGGAVRGSLTEEVLCEADKHEAAALLAKPDKKSLKYVATVGGGKAAGGKAGGGGGGKKKAAAPLAATTTAAGIRVQQRQKAAERKASVATTSKGLTLSASARSEASAAAAAAAAAAVATAAVLSATTSPLVSPKRSGGSGSVSSVGSASGARTATASTRVLKSSNSANSVLTQSSGLGSAGLGSPLRPSSSALRTSPSSVQVGGGEERSVPRRASFSSSRSSDGEGLLGSAVHAAALERKLEERDAELLAKDGLVQSMQKRLADLNRALEESDANRAQQTASLKRERERVGEVESSYQQALSELEEQLEEALVGKDELEQELEQRESEVEQLCAEVEDREARIDELKLMLKKMLETSSSNPSGAGEALGGQKGLDSPQRKALEQLPASGASGGGRSARAKGAVRRAEI